MLFRTRLTARPPPIEVKSQFIARAQRRDDAFCLTFFFIIILQMTKTAHRVDKLQRVPPPTEEADVGIASRPMVLVRPLPTPPHLPDSSSTEGWNNFDLLRLMSGDTGVAIRRSRRKRTTLDSEAKLAKFEPHQLADTMAPRHNTFCCPMPGPAAAAVFGGYGILLEDCETEMDLWKQCDQLQSHTMPTQLGGGANYSRRNSISL
jgi:hypothetical protein